MVKVIAYWKIKGKKENFISYGNKKLILHD
jgi:hypothetical protein